MNKGFIQLHRSLLEWEWYDDNNTKILFLHCLLKANYKDKNYRGKTISRGSFITGRDLLANELGLSVQQIRTSLTKLKSTNEITIKSTPQGTVIEVVKYNDYQEATNKTTNDQPTSNQQVTTTNNINNINNINNTMSWIDEADATYLSICENFYKRLVELDRVKKNTEWKSKSWYDAFRLLLTTDGVSTEEFNRVMKYYFATPRTQYTPIADSPVSVRSKWQKLKDYQQRGSNGCKIDNSNLDTRP